VVVVDDSIVRGPQCFFFSQRNLPARELAPMRILMAPAGSRGDFQPLLAVAVALRAAGHEVLLFASPNFVAEAGAFAVPVRALGFDVEVFTREIGISRLRSVYELFKVGRQVVAMIDDALPLMQNPDLVIGAGAQFIAPTLAERFGVPYVYVAYTPQAFRSRYHAPGMFPFSGLPGFVNRLLWAAFAFSARLVFAAPLNRKRQSIGLPPVRDLYEHFFPQRTTLLAADPELAPAPPDCSLAHPAIGALHLTDQRPIDPSIERFLEAGAPPVYVGFGSMPDRDPEATARLFVEAARLAGVRLLLSSGWARFAGAFGDDVLVIGPTSHTLLFPRVAAIVHHGGAGTTSAALRAGRPQIVVPHAFDQFQWARFVEGKGLGPAAIVRPRLTAKRLAKAMQQVISDPSYRSRAEAMAASVQARNANATAVATIEAIARGGIASNQLAR
jgi:vancomycin aglycone glucosyltransferase